MLNHIRNLFSSSPREEEPSSPAGSLSLPSCPVVIRRARQPQATATSLSSEELDYSFLNTPPSTIAFLLSNLDVPPSPLNISQQSSDFLKTPPSTIVQFIPKTSVNINPKSAPVTESSLAAPSEIVDFDEQGHEILPPITPYIHPSSPTFFAAMSLVFNARKAVKRSSPSADDNDIESSHPPKRVKSEAEHLQVKSPTPSVQQSPPSQRASATTATVLESDNDRTPRMSPNKRKRSSVDDINDIEDDDYLAPSDSDSTASLHNGPAQKKPAHEQATTNNPTTQEKAPHSSSPNRRAKRARRARSDSLYVDKEASDEGEYELPETYERDQLTYQFTREKARRLAEAVKVPEDSSMCDEERDLYLDLALRGCKPVMSFDWARDFSTLPESLFSVRNNTDKDEDDLTFKTARGSDFAARRAFQDLLKIGGYVRDCKLLTVQPEVVIERAVRKYIRWAVADSRLRTTAATIPLHTIYTQRPNQTTLSAVTRLARRMERQAERHQKAHGDQKDAYWPTLTGFLICGPILTIISLDTNPNSETWTKDLESRVKFLGQFDMSEIDQDVWNSLAIAIAVIHLRQSLGRLADAYSGPCFPRFRGQSDDTDDEDL